MTQAVQVLNQIKQNQQEIIDNQVRVNILHDDPKQVLNEMLWDLDDVLMESIA
jgi:hypothetical protein